MVIAVDAFGGDNAPQAIVQGVAAASLKNDTKFVLTGDEGIIKSILKSIPHNHETISVFHAPEKIEMDEHPAEAVREKRNSSMVAAMNLLRNKEVDAVISAGNTGAILVSAISYVRRIQGISRPALGTILPADKNPVILIDGGANVDVRPECLVDFAKMGSIYAKTILGISEPHVGLLSVGTEDTKGNKQTKDAFPLLKEANGIVFDGNMEARSILSGDTHVVVADGFAGNVCLKSIEGTAITLFTAIKEVLNKGFIGKLCGLMLRKKLRPLKERLSLDAHGGAPLLGIDGVVVKAHGSSKAVSIEIAIAQTEAMLKAGIVDIIKNNIQAV